MGYHSAEIPLLAVLNVSPIFCFTKSVLPTEKVLETLLLEFTCLKKDFKNGVMKKSAKIKF